MKKKFEVFSFNETDGWNTRLENYGPSVVVCGNALIKRGEGKDEADQAIDIQGEAFGVGLDICLKTGACPVIWIDHRGPIHDFLKEGIGGGRRSGIYRLSEIDPEIVNEHLSVLEEKSQSPEDVFCFFELSAARYIRGKLAELSRTVNVKEIEKLLYMTTDIREESTDLLYEDLSYSVQKKSVRTSCEGITAGFLRNTVVVGEKFKNNSELNTNALLLCLGNHSRTCERKIMGGVMVKSKIDKIEGKEPISVGVLYI